MIKELIIGLVYVVLITIVVYPISNSLADVMVLVMSPSVLTSILVNVVRYFGFFIGLGTVNWIYKGLNLQQQQTYNGGY